MPKIISTLMYSLILCGIVSCTAKVSPDVKLSSVQTPFKWSNKNSFINNGDPVIEWWKQFNDPQLNGYINDVLQSNFDLRAAAAKVQKVKALRTEAQSQLYPQINIQVKDSKYQIFDADNGSSLFPLNNNQSLNFFDAGFDATWEIDLWGKQRWNVIAIQENIEVANEYKRAVLISLIAELARNYMELRGNQEQLVILQKNVDIQNRNLNLIQYKHKIGLSRTIDVTEAQTLFAATHSKIANLKSSIKVSAYNIAVLTGRNPDALLNELLPKKFLPRPVNVIAVGLPANLILRRPDIRQAQRELGGAIASVGSATANLYPAIGINGNIGFANMQLGDLINFKGGLWGITPSINWKLFDKKALTARLNASKEQVKVADASLRQTVLNAIKDVETSISYFDSAQKTQKDLKKAALLSLQSYNIIKESYRIGLRNKLDVLEAEKIYLNNKSQLIASEVQVNLQIINLYKSLGGGWERV